MEKINTVKWQLLMCALLLIICLLVISLVVILLAGTIGLNVSLPVSITLIFVGLMVLAIALVVYLVHQLTKRKPNKEVKDDNFIAEVDEDKKGVRGVETTPNPAQGTVACGNLEWQALVCALFVFFCLLTTSVVVITLAHYLSTDVALPVSITLILVGVTVLPIAFIVYCVLKWTRHKKQSSLRDPKKTERHTYAYVCSHREAAIETESCHSTCQQSEEDEIPATRVETMADLNPEYGTATSEPTTPDMVDKYDCELPELNEEGICDNLPQSTDPKMMGTHSNVNDPSIIAPGREVIYDYPTGVGSGEDKIAAVQVEMIPNPAYETVTCKSTTPHMADEYNWKLPELNKERICLQDETVTCKSTTPHMADEYDWKLPEHNEERICLQDMYLQKPADVKMTNTHDNAYDPAIIEPTKEVVCDYSSSSGVVSEDEIAAGRVEMSANPSTSKTTTPDMVDEYDCELPELNVERNCDNSSQPKDPKMIDTCDNVYDPSIIAPGREVVYNYPTGVGSGEDEIAAVQVELTANPAYETVTCCKEHVSNKQLNISKTPTN